MPTPTNPTQITGRDDWRLLLGLNVYRLLLVILLLGLERFGVTAQLFQNTSGGLFHSIGVLYGIFALLLVAPALTRNVALTRLTLANFGLDAIAVIALTYAVGGVSSGLGVLLIPSGMGTGFLLNLRFSLLCAALGSVGMFGMELFRHSTRFTESSDYTSAGVLGGLFFVTAITSHAIANRVRASEALAARVGSEFEDLAALNQTVLENMLIGIVVVDANDQVRAINRAASVMLDSNGSLGAQIGRHSPKLASALSRWRAGSASPESPIAPLHAGGIEMIVRFRRLHGSPKAPVLLLLEDASRVREQAQQIKLAALGRLSASIAHEIRNPLSAITHASQLLAESGALPAADQRLLDIIQRHGQRIDRIVKDVSNLSSGAADPKNLPINDWLPKAVNQYQEAHPTRNVRLELKADLVAHFDPNHLQQVLFNLLDNAFFHGGAHNATPDVLIRVSPLYLRGGALDVEDNGPGVNPQTVDKLFEPFFTTANTGTGLGLFLARELCAYNGARLSLHQGSLPGACFRVTFILPESNTESESVG